ncbi:hypothetical protein DFH09DRAFT_1318838 [Mycena vulgaris]|nr:hypothetical protein DFH09DRAFT_1318838 [Mycena vulgaris]
MADILAEPQFPLDLERYIFELSALSRPVSVPNLVRVAWRVKQWVEPLLYRTLFFGRFNPIDGLPFCNAQICARIASAKSASFLRDSVRNIFLVDISQEDMDTIISTCPAVENLSSCIHPAHSHPAFMNITQLALIEFPHDNTHFGTLTTLPRLTHLAVNGLAQMQLCLFLLKGSNALRTMVMYYSPQPTLPRPGPSTLPDNLRFVLMAVTVRLVVDWQRGLLTGLDYWTRADAFIAKRMSGEIDYRTYFLEDAG